MTEVSIILCTYNRAARLREALESLAGVDVPVGLSWEVVLVDNNSRDTTRAVAESFQRRLPIRYLFEPSPGQTVARNRGVCEAAGELLVFTDDDIRFEPQWLAQIVQASRSRPDADFFGGRILPLWVGGRPAWLRPVTDERSFGFPAKYDYGSQIAPFGPQDESPYGANLAIRRRVFGALNGFRTDLGPKGNVNGKGGETELLSRIRAQGYMGVYVGTATVHHLVEVHQRTCKAMWHYGLGKGRAWALTHPYPDRGITWRVRWRAFRFLVKGLRQLLRRRGDNARLCWLGAAIEIGKVRTWRCLVDVRPTMGDSI